MVVDVHRQRHLRVAKNAGDHFRMHVWQRQEFGAAVAVFSGLGQPNKSAAALRIAEQGRFSGPKQSP